MFNAFGSRTLLRDNEIVLGADLFTTQPQILSASVGFDGIIGVDQTEKSAIQAGAVWSTDVTTCPISGDPPPIGVMTSAVPATGLSTLYDCNDIPNHWDGFPVCFSWPILPSSISRDHIQYTRSDGAVFSPSCISIYPNHEFNERHCLVLFDDFINRVLPGASEPTPLQNGRIFMDKLEIVGDLMLVGPRGKLTSAKGLYRNATWEESSYVSGPVFIGARLSPLSGLGEGSTTLLEQINAIGANSGLDLYGTGNETFDRQLYRLRLFYSGGMTPDGVTSLKPTQFNDYFKLIFEGGTTISETETATSIDGSTVTVLGLADLGFKQDAYDICYLEDRDNYIDIIIHVDGDARVLNKVQSVLAFSTGNSLYNPGGPGRTPSPGVSYTAAAPANQSVPVLIDLERTYETTYCERKSGRKSTDPNVCDKWRQKGQLKEVNFGSPVMN